MQVVQKVHRKDWQEELLAAGILGVLKGWLEPIRGSLPLLEVWSDPSLSCLNDLIPGAVQKRHGCVAHQLLQQR